MKYTSLENVKAWCGITHDTDDALIERLIDEASATVLNYIGRMKLGYTETTETVSGRGTQKLRLAGFPVLSVSSLSINGQDIPEAANCNSFGYFLEPHLGSPSGKPQFLTVILGQNAAYQSFAQPSTSPSPVVPTWGGMPRPFSLGYGNITVSYSYGYAVMDEAATVPAASPYTVTPDQPYGLWGDDVSVTYADGTALTLVEGTPAEGQYNQPSLIADDTVYTFNAADAGKDILISYSYVPFDIEQACVEIVGERYSYKGRIGQASRSLNGQETASYMVRDGLTASIKQRLDPYRKMRL